MSDNRDKAKQILFETLQKSGWEPVLFQTPSVTDSSGLIDTVIDAMIKFKKTRIRTKK